MTYLGKENAFFFPAPTITINFGLMAHPGYTFKYATTQTHPVTQKARMHTLVTFAPLFVKAVRLCHCKQGYYLGLAYIK